MQKKNKLIFFTLFSFSPSLSFFRLSPSAQAVSSLSSLYRSSISISATLDKQQWSSMMTKVRRETERERKENKFDPDRKGKTNAFQCSRLLVFSLPPPTSHRTDSSGALLVLLLETHLGAWQALTRRGSEGAPPRENNSNNISPPTLIAAVAAFVGAYELEAEGNGVVVLGVHAGEWLVCCCRCALLSKREGERRREKKGTA